MSPKFPVMTIMLTWITYAVVTTPLSAESQASIWGLSVRSIGSTVFKDEELLDVTRELGIVRGRPVPTKLVEKRIRDWRGTRIESLIVEAELVQGMLEVMITANRKRRLRSISFKNVDLETQTELKARFGLSEGSRIDSRALQESASFLSESLKAQGYYLAAVNVNVSDIPKSDESVVEFIVSQNDPTVVRNLVIKGISGEDNEEILKIVEVRRTLPLRKKDLERSLEKIITYLNENQFPLAKIDSVDTVFSHPFVDITVHVETGRKIQILFTGNRVLDDVALREMISLDGVSEEDNRRQMISLIENKYRTLGFHFCRVRVTDEEKSDMLVRKISIEEGQKVIIDRFQVVGLSGALTTRLVEQLFFAGAPGVLGRRVYWEEGLADARRLLEKALEDKGYLKAKVNSMKPVFDPDERGVQLFVEIEAGVRSEVGAVTIDGNENLSSVEILTIAGLSERTPYSPDKLSTVENELITHYQERGYLDARVNISQEETVYADAAVMKVHIEIIEGIQYYVGEISVIGNNKTDSGTILSEMKVKPGDVFVPSKVRASEEDVGLLGIFSKVELTPHSSLVNPRKKDIKIVVIESRPGLGEIGVGAAYEDPRFRLRSFLGLAYRNLFGQNHTASFRGEVALPISRDNFIPFVEYVTVVGFRAPYPFSLPFVFNAQIGLDRFELSPDGPKLTNRARLEERIERKVSSVTTLYYRIHRYERSSTQDLSAKNANPVVVIGSTGPGVTVDLRDNLFNPMRGSYHTFDMEYAHPSLLSSDGVHFMMGISRNSFYFPFVAGTGLRFFLGLGYARAMEEGLTVPSIRLQNEMALGGHLSIRGFSLRRFKPDDDSQDSAFYNFRSEFAFPIFGDLGGAIFVDSGQIFPNGSFPERRRHKERHDGVGIGFRYKTPVGPFVIDLAYGLGDDREGLKGGDKEGLKFYFTLGTI